MRIAVPKQVQLIIESLNEKGFEAFAVGGCVRDSLLGREPKDWDITTSAKPEEVKACFSHTIDTGIQHGTVTVMIDHEGYEVTTYRVDGEYEDSRHPKEVTFTSSLEEDLKRRDFTINAMAYHPELGFVDLFCGQEDLRNGVVRCVGNPKERFTEDALRMLRALRFAAQLGFVVEEETAEAIRTLSGTLERISAERIHAEMDKLITSPHPEAVRQVYELGLTRVFFPEFDRMMETPQNNPHHCYSVGEHTIAAMQQVPQDRVLRWTMLFHDISKPECRTTDEHGVDHFYGHPGKGEARAKEVMQRLKFDNDTKQKVSNLVKWHDVTPTAREYISPGMVHEANPEISERSVRRLLAKVGKDAFPNLFLVRKADLLAQSNYYREEKLDVLLRFRQTYESVMLKEQAVCVKDLKVNGKDLMELGIPKGPEIGFMLTALLNVVLDDPGTNTKERLLALAKEKMEAVPIEEK